MPAAPPGNANAAVAYLVPKLGQNLRNPLVHTRCCSSVEIPMSSDLIYSLQEFIRLKFRVFTKEETILQEISAL